MVFTVAGLLGRTASRVTFHKEYFTALWLAAGTVGQLARQCWALSDLFTDNFFARAHAALGAVDTEFCEFLGLFCVLIEPQAEGVFNHAGDKGCGLSRGEAIFGLAGKLGIFKLRREHKTTAIPDIVWGQFDASGQQVSKFAELAHGIQEAGTQTVDVGATLRCWDQIDVALLHQIAAIGHPLYGPVGSFIGGRISADKRCGGQYIPACQ